MDYIAIFLIVNCCVICYLLWEFLFSQLIRLCIHNLVLIVIVTQLNIHLFGYLHIDEIVNNRELCKHTTSNVVILGECKYVHIKISWFRMSFRLSLLHVSLYLLRGNRFIIPNLSFFLEFCYTYKHNIRYLRIKRYDFCFKIYKVHAITVSMLK